MIYNNLKNLTIDELKKMSSEYYYYNNSKTYELKDNDDSLLERTKNRLDTYIDNQGYEITVYEISGNSIGSINDNNYIMIEYCNEDDYDKLIISTSKDLLYRSKQQQYLNEYKKEKTKIFKADLKIEEYEKICSILQKANLNKAQFIRQAIKDLENKLQK